jgi:hypothetical protein
MKVPRPRALDTTALNACADRRRKNKKSSSVQLAILAVVSRVRCAALRDCSGAEKPPEKGRTPRLNSCRRDKHRGRKPLVSIGTIWRDANANSTHSTVSVFRFVFRGSSHINIQKYLLQTYLQEARNPSGAGLRMMSNLLLISLICPSIKRLRALTCWPTSRRYICLSFFA